MNTPKKPYFVEIGSEDYPLSVRDADGKYGQLNSEKGVIHLPSWLKEKPFTEQTDDMIGVQDQVFGQLIRNQPTSSMSRLFVRELERRDPNRTDQRNRSYISGLIGAPAVGKSFMYKLLGKLTHPRGAYVFDCKGVDMGALFQELVFDMSPAVQETNAIDAKILRGNRQGLEHGLKPENVNILRAMCGDAFHEEMQGERKIISIDWKAIQLKNEKGFLPESHDEQERLTKKFQEELRQICLTEGITASDNLAKTGLVQQDGIAIRACDPKSPDYGRPIMLEDPDQAKPGTMRKLDEWLPVLTGAEQHCTVAGAGGRIITINRSQFTLSFHVSVTQNQAIEDMGSRTLDDPTKSRLSLLIETAPDAGRNDWVERICQQLTGVSTYQLYQSAKELQDDEALLHDVLMHYRTMGLTQAQIRDLKTLDEEQIQNIRQAKKTIALAEHLGEFLFEFSQLINPKSKYHREQNTNLSPEYEAFLTEQSKDFNLRAVTNLFNNASTVFTVAENKPVSFRDVIAKNKIRKSVDGDIQSRHLINIEDRLKNRGDRLDQYIMDLVKKTVIPEDAATRGIDVSEAKSIYDIAVKKAAECGLGISSLKRNAHAAPSVAELYNLDLSKEPLFRAKPVRQAMIELLKQENPGLELPKDPDRLINLATVERAMQHAEEMKLYAGADANALLVPNTDPDSFEKNPFRQVMLKDTLPETDDGTAFHARTADLLPRDVLLLALYTPALAQKILPNLWIKAENDRFGSGQVSDMAQNDNNTELAITTLLVQAKGKAEPLHIIRNNKQGTMMLVGGSLDESIKKQLKSDSIAYFDYRQPDCADAINSEGLPKLIPQKNANPSSSKELIHNLKIPCFVDNLKMAFLIRNGDSTKLEENLQLSLGELMSNPKKIRTTSPINVTGIEDLASLKHLQGEYEKKNKAQKSKA